MYRTSIWVLLFLIAFAAIASTQAPTPGTLVFISSIEECRVSVDGKEVFTVPAGEVRRVYFAPGEHQISADCTGRMWKDTIAVGGELKVVTIPARSRTSAEVSKPASAAAPQVGTGCILLFDSNREVAAGRWRVGAVVRTTPCEKAQIRPGSVAISLGGKTANDFARKDIPEFDSGAVGSTVELEILARDGEVRKTILTRAAIPKFGTVDVLLPEGQITSTTFGGDLPISDAVWDAVRNSQGALPNERACRGIAVACSSRNPLDCTLGAGCIERGNCSGASSQTTCVGRDRYICETTPGCFWAASTRTCDGLGQSCFGQDAAACESIRGCTWIPLCMGIPTPCASLSERLCTSQPGCS